MKKLNDDYDHVATLMIVKRLSTDQVMGYVTIAEEDGIWIDMPEQYQAQLPMVFAAMRAMKIEDNVDAESDTVSS